MTVSPITTMSSRRTIPIDISSKEGLLVHHRRRTREVLRAVARAATGQLAPAGRDAHARSGIPGSGPSTPRRHPHRQRDSGNIPLGQGRAVRHRARRLLEGFAVVFWRWTRPATLIHQARYARRSRHGRSPASRRRQRTTPGPSWRSSRLRAAGVDFVQEQCAKELPIRTLSDMVGIPESSAAIAHAADALVSWADPICLDGRNALEVLVANQFYLHQVANQRGCRPSREPRHRPDGALVHAESTVAGDRRRWPPSSCCSRSRATTHAPGHTSHALRRSPTTPTKELAHGRFRAIGSARSSRGSSSGGRRR